LITWDVDPSPEIPFEARARSVDVAIDLCEETGVRSTFFVTALADHVGAREVERMQDLGHQVGCHGLDHEDQEEYDRMPEAMQRDYIEQATHRLGALGGTPPVVFRSPRVKISARTMKLLAEYGYVADSSVCSQRMDLVSSNLIHFGWLFAPRLPYRPHETNAFTQGDLDIWEIPISAMGIPFISALLSVLGLPMMKLLFRLLYAESRRTGKPIVYLAHPIEFTTRWLKPVTIRDLSPMQIRTHGLMLRKLLYGMDPETWRDATRELLKFMSTFPGVTFLPVGEYVHDYLGGNGSG